MNKKLKTFTYSQNSINTYKSCPVKFKYKYIDGVNWMKDDLESRSYYDSLKMGLDFHLICERYFDQIPVGIELSSEEDVDKFSKWLDVIKSEIPIEQDKKYLTEYEVLLNLNGRKIQAKYDLIVIGKDSIDIWDWKTEAKKLNYKNVESRMQTIVYMYLAKEVIPSIFNIDVDFTGIKMNYIQPGYENGKVSIAYSNEKHTKNKEIILNYINNIENTDFGDVIESKFDYFLNEYYHLEFDEELNKSEKLNVNLEFELQDSGKIYLQKNEKHCSYCEFNKLCNNSNVDYEILESELYGD